MKNARLVINVFILVIVPIILNRQRIIDYIQETGFPEKSGNALHSIKETSSKTFSGAKNISTSAYSKTKQTIGTVSSNVGEKVEEIRQKDKEDLPVPKILKSNKNDGAGVGAGNRSGEGADHGASHGASEDAGSDVNEDIQAIKNINVQHEKEIGSKMLENIAKLNEEKVAKHRDNEESLEPGFLHQKHKRALDSKSVEFVHEKTHADAVDGVARENEAKEDSDESLSLFEKHRKQNEEHIQKIGRKSGI